MFATCTVALCVKYKNYIHVLPAVTITTYNTDGYSVIVIDYTGFGTKRTLRFA